MTDDRRSFLGQLAAGTAALASAGSTKPGIIARLGDPSTQKTQWDVSWVSRIKGSHKAVFDCTEIEDGNGLLRALVWKKQYGEVLGVPASDMTSVLVFRHYGIALAM